MEKHEEEGKSESNRPSNEHLTPLPSSPLNFILEVFSITRTIYASKRGSPQEKQQS